MVQMIQMIQMIPSASNKDASVKKNIKKGFESSKHGQV